jgi:hypothetical protein
MYDTHGPRDVKRELDVQDALVVRLQGIVGDNVGHYDAYAARHVGVNLRGMKISHMQRL